MIFLLIPNFPTRLKYEHRIDGELILAKSGDFEESFIDKELLENKGYHNKYNALLHGGYVENIIYNELAKNETKVLVIGHSYGRSLVQYLGLGCKSCAIWTRRMGVITKTFWNILRSTNLI